MLAYTLISAGLLVLASSFALVGLHPLAMALFPVPIALYWALGMHGRSLGLVACAALAAWSSTGSLSAVGTYVIAADTGVLMGMASVRRWPFGWTVTAVTLVAFALVALGVLADWDAVRHAVTIFVNARIADIEKSNANEITAVEAAIADTLRWLDLNSAYLCLGMMFGTMLIGSTVLVALVAARLRRFGASAPSGLFSEMRSPEWLVWVAIALAVLWFVDRKWPNEVLRLITWNSAVGLACVYWVNGFSILIFALNAFKVSPFLFYAVVIGLFYLNLQFVLCAVGLFDTWWDFRRRFAHAAAARLNKPPDDLEM